MSERPVKRKYDAHLAAGGGGRAPASASAPPPRSCSSRDGYARTSIRAVAKAAGVAEATIYLAFPDKAALLDAVIVRATRDNPSEALDAIAAAPPDEILAAPGGVQRRADGPRRPADRARRERER